MAEDHGWDFTVAHKGAKYVCACSANDGDMPFEAHVTISKSRSIRDRLRGRNPFTEDDPVLTAIDAALRGSSDVTKLEREPISK